MKNTNAEVAVVPVVWKEGKRWLLLNKKSNTGLLRAVKISKPHQVLDWDGHHCNQVSVKGSIRFYPKKWS
ncbi:hypothetical protein ACFL1B_04640 [Nanoarchaeota archaeon]